MCERSPSPANDHQCCATRPLTHLSVILNARAMGPALRMRREKCKADARVPDETVQEFHQAGFFKVLQPEQWGGYAMDPQVFYTLGFEIAKHCPSSAWILGVIAVHNWQLAVLWPWC